MSWRVVKNPPPWAKAAWSVREEDDGRIVLYADHVDLTPQQAELIAKTLIEAAKRARPKRPH